MAHRIFSLQCFYEMFPFRQPLTTQSPSFFLLFNFDSFGYEEIYDNLL
jgi:hypothetical protein